jgi:hypothetical protein
MRCNIKGQQRNNLGSTFIIIVSPSFPDILDLAGKLNILWLLYRASIQSLSP